MTKQDRNRRRMTALVDGWRKSGQSMSQFARAHGVSRDKLVYWRIAVGAAAAGKRHRRRRASPVEFAAVRVVGAQAAPAAIEVTLADGVRLTVNDGTSSGLLSTVLAALRRAC